MYIRFLSTNMGSQVFSISVLVFCGLMFTLAFFQIPKRRFTLGIAIIIACGVLLRFYSAYDFQLNEWDESYHALVAKHLMKDFFNPVLYSNPIFDYDYRDWTANHFWLHRQPLPLWTSALSMKLLGVNELAFRLPSLMLSLLTMIFMYRIAVDLFGREVGFLATFFFSIHSQLIELVAGRISPDHFEVFFMFFFLAGIYCTLRYFRSYQWWWNLLVGLCIGLAYLSKETPALFILVLWLVIAIQKRQKYGVKVVFGFCLALIVAACVSLPWQFYAIQNFHQEAIWETQTNFFKFFIYDKNHIQPYYFYFLNSLPKLFGTFIALPLVWYVYHAIKRRNHPVRWLLTIWMLVPLVVYSFASTKMHSYVIVSAPAFFMVLGIFIVYMALRAQVMMFKSLAYGVIAFTIAMPVYETVKSFNPSEYVEKNPKWVVEMKELGDRLKYQDKTVIFNVSRPIDLMFYSDCTAYNFELAPDTKSDLQKKVLLCMIVLPRLF